MVESGIDLKRLRRTVAARKASRSVGTGLGGRLGSGVMALVRANLVAFEELRAAGATWAEIAAGLAEQGMTQGDGEPITAKRLTALVTLVRTGEARRVQKAAERKARGDVVAGRPATPATRLVEKKLQLSAELARARPKAPDQGPSESDLRREAFDRHDHLFKRD